MLDASGGAASRSSLGVDAVCVDHNPNMEDKFEASNKCCVQSDLQFCEFAKMDIYEGFAFIDRSHLITGTTVPPQLALLLPVISAEAQLQAVRLEG